MPVKDPNNFEPVPPQELFEIPTNITGGGMMPDGKHFLGFRATGAIFMNFPGPLGPKKTISKIVVPLAAHDTLAIVPE
jgi:hypothetical protein